MSGETKMRDKFKDLNMSEEEVRRFSEAMKKEEFRKLLLDYAEEISDPKNRELYEREISALEAERGMNVTFIHPQPGYCIATSQESSVIHNIYSLLGLYSLIQFDFLLMSNNLSYYKLIIIVGLTLLELDRYFRFFSF